AVVCAADGARAFAVTEDGVSVIALAAAGGPHVARTIALTDDPTESADTRDVSITPKGNLALVRREGSPAVRLVDLTSGARTEVLLSGAVTDLDLADGGQRAVAVVRGTSEVAVFDLTGAAPPAAPPVTELTVTGETIGSVALAPGGRTAILYSNAADIERITVLDLSGRQPSYHTVRLRGPVRSVFATGDGQHAVVIHGGPPPVPEPPGGGPPTGTGGATGANPDAGAD